jgi:protoporphyrin/coproporphyrin ferrochelatase
MSKVLPEPAWKHGTPARTAVILINLGTPEAPTAPALKTYLREFLSDPRVVEIPRPIWWLILNGIILNTRPKKSAAKYASIWLKEGSPLRVYTDKQATLLQGYLSQRTKASFVVDYAMRYGNPGIPQALRKLREQNCQRILLVPMYPQYAASTTATVCDIVFDELKRMRNMPALRTVRNFHDHPGYIKALANNINDYWMKHGRPEKLLMSFHGLPEYTLKKGDPYRQLPVAFRQTRMAQALHRRHAEGTGTTTDQAPGRDLPRLRRRLPGDAGRNCAGRQGRVPACRRRGIPLHPLPQRPQRLDARSDRPGAG